MISLIDALASALKIPAIMCVLMGVIEGKDLGKYILGSIAIMAVSIVVGILCKMSSTVLQTEGGYTTAGIQAYRDGGCTSDMCLWDISIPTA